MELWFRELEDIPYQLADVILAKWVAQNKWSPSIADIREQAVEIQQGAIPDWGEGWNDVLRAIRRHGMYDIPGAMASLSGITKQCVERMGFRNICMTENIATERANFRMLYEQLAERQKKEAQLPTALAGLIEQMRSGKTLESGKLVELNE
jgi:hypothetical protein